MKATHVRVPGSGFKTPKEFKGGTCVYCGKELRDYQGVRVGEHIYCDFDHYMRRRDAEESKVR